MALQTERQRIAHLLRRFGLGASESEMAYYSQGGLQGAIQKLVDYDKLPDPFPVDKAVFAPKGVLNNPRFAQLHWYSRLLVTNRPLEERMTLFWHNHFATSAEKVDSGEAMFTHIDTLRANCLGKFDDLLLAVSKDPAMLYWLDNELNVKGKANENFAREVMELFTLGIGHYTEQDVQNGAKAFTGWGYGIKRGNRLVPSNDGIPKRNVQFIYMPERHDDSAKTFLGSRGNFNGDEILGMLIGNHQSSVFIVHKLWEEFVYPKPEPELVQRLADDFRSHDRDMKYLVRKIMGMDEFYSEKAERAVVKNPVDFTLAIARSLGLGANIVDALQNAGEDQQLKRRATLVPAMILQATKGQGMELMFPPDVSGWHQGQEWISTATIVDRIKVADVIFRGISVDIKGKNRPARNLNAYQAMPLFAEDPTPEGAVKKLISTFDVALPANKVSILVQEAKHAAPSGIDEKNANFVANAVCRLIFGSPEFQFC